jgi:hypothetical protein
MPHAKYSRAKVIILTFIAIAFPFFVNELLGKSTLLDSKYLSFMTREFWYRHFVTGGPRRTRIDEFKIVNLSQGVEPGNVLGQNRCTHRAFMAKLLLKMADYDPRMIVLDKWYNRIPGGVCAPGTDGKDGTQKLRDAIQSVSAKVPLVIAAGSYNRDNIQNFCHDLRYDDLQPEQVVLDVPESLNENIPADRVTFGLAWIEKDPRKIPLGWTAFRNCQDVTNKATPEPWPTLAAAAAALLDPNIMLDNNLTELQRQIKYPFTKLLPAGRFESISAMKLVCNHPGENVDWNGCIDEGDKNLLNSLRHKVVIVGEEGGDDKHLVDDANYTGLELQANYIASLLDESVLRPTSDSVNYAGSFLWLGLIFCVFYVWKPVWPELAVLVSALMTFGVGWFFSSVITKQFGIFANVVPPTILEIIGLYLAQRIEILLEQHKAPARATGRVNL